MMFEYLEEDRAMGKDLEYVLTEGEFLSVDIITIEAPVALEGDAVVFDNPRKKTNGDWDTGVVVKVLTRWGAEHNVYSHAYYVKPHGKNYVTKVGYVERVVFP